MTDVEPGPDHAPTSRPPRVLLVIALVAGLTAVVAGVLISGGDDDAVKIGNPAPSDLGPASSGHDAPDVTFTMFDGRQVTFADFEGQPLVVNFFASWCAPCVAEMPDIEALHRELGDQVTFLGINETEPQADGQRIADQTGVTYQLARDPDGAVFAAFDAFSMPTSVFIAPDGRITDLRGGKLTIDQLRSIITEQLLA